MPSLRPDRTTRASLPKDWSRWCEHIRNKAEFYIQGIFQWDDIDISDLNRWLGNFPGDEGQYYAMQLLNRFIFYSERDVIRMLRHGVHKVLLYKPSISWLLDSNFAISLADQERRVREALTKIVFSPLLDRDKPSESGNTLCRYLNRDLDVASSQICQPRSLARVKDVQVVIVDDFIGSGEQIIDFWNEPKLERRSLAALARENHLQVAYLCLVATRSGLTEAARHTAGLELLTCEVLEEHHRVFHVPSMYFGGASEVARAKRYLHRICSSSGVLLLGFRNLDYAIAFHHAVPDATLPLFYESKRSWKRLIRRRRA